MRPISASSAAACTAVPSTSVRVALAPGVAGGVGAGPAVVGSAPVGAAFPVAATPLVGAVVDVIVAAVVDRVSDFTALALALGFAAVATRALDLGALVLAFGLPEVAALALGLAAAVLALGLAAAVFPLASSGAAGCAGADPRFGWTAARLWLRRWGRLRGSPPRTCDGRGSVIALRSSRTGGLEVALRRPAGGFDRTGGAVSRCVETGQAKLSAQR